MLDSAQLKAALAARGLRMTPQRQLILDAITALPGHISADAVHQVVIATFPEVNVTTVYRTLELLQELGFLTHSHSPSGVGYYHLAEDGRHQHLHCRKCGSEQTVGLDVLYPLDSSLRRDFGFQADLPHLTLTGLCRDCSAVRAVENSGAASGVHA